MCKNRSSGEPIDGVRVHARLIDLYQATEHGLLREHRLEWRVAPEHCVLTMTRLERESGWIAATPQISH
jgi:hypothetical protein